MQSRSFRKSVPSRRRQAGEISSAWAVGVGGAALVALGYHGTSYDVQQTTYGSREECQQDWGDEAQCRDNGNHVFVGPRYYWDSRRNVPIVLNPDGSERIATNARIGRYGGSFGRTAFVGEFSRGGFGGIGRGFSGGRGG